MHNRYHSFLFLVVLISGCAAIETLPGAERITISRQAPEANCELLGEVIGSQGNLVTADFTSDENLIKGARNDLRNEAMYLGANYVVIETQNHSQNTGESGTGGTYSSVVIGNAYWCPDLKQTRASQLVETFDD